MTNRIALYFAPPRHSLLQQAAEGWLARPDLRDLTISARRYGFHATIKAPMALADARSETELRAAIADYVVRRKAAPLGLLTPTLIEGFLALLPVVQGAEVTALAQDVVETFEPFRAPLSEADRARRLRAPLTARQRDLLAQFGYPYVAEEFRFHMTLTDRLPAPQAEMLSREARDWFAPALAEPMRLDRLVLFRETAPGGDFVRLDPDFELVG